MQSVIVKDRQNILDIAALSDGDVMACFELALQCGKSISDELVSGEILNIENTSFYDEEIVNELRQRRAKPATAEGGEELRPDGIGYMEIGNDFIVS